MPCEITSICGVALYFFFQAEDGIRDLVRSRGLGDVYKRQSKNIANIGTENYKRQDVNFKEVLNNLGEMKSTNSKHLKLPQVNQEDFEISKDKSLDCLLYTSDAADERSSVDLGGRRIIKKTTR